VTGAPALVAGVSYLLAINVLTALAFAWDKHRAQAGG
jgi:hypothetical protein